MINNIETWLLWVAPPYTLFIYKEEHEETYF